jgi:hypothetical protein
MTRSSKCLERKRVKIDITTRRTFFDKNVVVILIIILSEIFSLREYVKCVKHWILRPLSRMNTASYRNRCFMWCRSKYFLAIVDKLMSTKVRIPTSSVVDTWLCYPKKTIFLFACRVEHDNPINGQISH